MIFSLIKFLIIFYIFWIVFATITWNYRPTMYVNAKYDIVSKAEINTLEESALYICQHDDRLIIYEQMIMCEDIKKSKIKFNIVEKKSPHFQFFKHSPKFTCYNLITLKSKDNNNKTQVIKDILEKKKENVLIFLAKNKNKKGIYYILRETKKPLVLINMIETKNKNRIFNKKFRLDYRIIKNYPIDKEPEDFMKWLENELYGYYEKLK